MSLNEYDDNREPGGDLPRWLDLLGRGVDQLDAWLRWPGRAIVGLADRLHRPRPPVCTCSTATAMVSPECPVHGPQLRGPCP